MEIKVSLIKKLSILFLVIPVIIFLLSWMKLWIGLISTCILIICTFFVFKKYISNENTMISINKKVFYLIIIIISLWCISSGIGRLYFQSADHASRNVILKDLVQFDWPVVYADNSFLTYYIGFWMVPALIGKVFLWIGCSFQIAIRIAHIMLLAWSLLGILLTYFLIISLLKKNDKKSQLTILTIFILFSGCDILGVLFQNSENSQHSQLVYHIEWWADNYQFSSITTQLYWVFNQAIPAWIVTLLIISNEDISTDIYLGVLLLLFSPFPAIGCALICAGKLIYILFKVQTKKLHSCLKQLLSIPNSLIVISVLPPLVAYLYSNTVVSANPTSVSGFNTFIGGLTFENIGILIAFMIFEYMIYIFLVYKNNKKQYLIYTCIVFLPIINVVRFGSSLDFQMRASIPLLFVLMLLIMKEACENVTYRNKKIAFSLKGIILAFVLIIGSVTPLIEIYRGYHYTRNGIKLDENAPKIEEFTEKSYNFVSPNYPDTLFKKYFGR